MQNTLEKVDFNSLHYEHRELEIKQSSIGVFAIEATQLPYDTHITSEARKLIGSIATKNIHVEPVEYESESTNVSLDTAIHKAYEGDMEALEMVRMNVLTDYLERAYKSGNITKVGLAKTDSGRLIQHGQLLADTYRNSLQYIHPPVLKERGKTEAINGARYQQYADLGVFKDNIVATFSLVTKKVDESDAKELGFFTDTMSLSIQIMSEDENGIYLESAFVAGRESAGDSRFDETVVHEMVHRLGVDFNNYDADEMLAHPIIIPKKIFSSAIELVEFYDVVASQKTGKRKFFGRDDTEHYDYEAYLIECQEREQNLQTEVESTVQKLLNKHTEIKTPTDATQALKELNDSLLKKRIVKDTSIDPTVIGQKAAYYVEHARHLEALHGHHKDLLGLQKKIEQYGRSDSCPDGGSKKVTSPLDGDIENSGTEETSQDMDDCEFTANECPKCHAKKVKVTCKNGKYYGDCGCVSD